MSCTKNQKKFWIFNWLGPHNPVETTVRKIFSNEYEVRRRCSECNVELDALWVDECMLVKHGYDVNKLHNMSRRSFINVDVEDLK